MFAVGLLMLALQGCSSAPVLPHASEVPLSKDTLSMLGRKGMQVGAPIFVRIFKEESELEIWKQRDDGRFYHFKTYPICNWSGEIGPKLKQGDYQAPEGFYTITPTLMNPNSQYYLSFNLGYPNAYDKSHGRTGDFVMVHGKCRSAGCYAMTDALMEEIYGLTRETLKAGHKSFPVHAFPFRMTDARMKELRKHRWYSFWQPLKRGYDFFEKHRIPPNVEICERRYIVGAITSASTDANQLCPAMRRQSPPPFTPLPESNVISIADGNKLKGIISADVEPTLADITSAKAQAQQQSVASQPAATPPATWSPTADAR